MPSITIPTQQLRTTVVGRTTVINPVLMLKVDGVVYVNGYRIGYNIGYRHIFPGYNQSTGDILLYSHSIAYGEDLPAISLNNVEVLLIG